MKSIQSPVLRLTLVGTAVAVLLALVLLLSQSDLAEAQEPAVNSSATGRPTISGPAQLGETLTAETSGISDEDKLQNAEFSYQWIRNDGSADAVIQDATESTYTLVAADEGKVIKVRVSFIDDAGNEESLTSEPTAAVTAVRPTEPLNLTVSRGNSQELDAAWQAPASDGGSAITGYTVQWKEAADSWDTPDDVSEETVAGTAHTITGLDNEGEYDVRVRAVNAIGDGPWSNTVTAALLTVPGAPAIESLTLDPRPPEEIGPPSYAELTIAWSGPADNGGAAITSYDVRLFPRKLPWSTSHGSLHSPWISSDVPAPEWTVWEDIWDSGALEVTFDGGKKGVEYEFQVRAVNDAGEGPWSAGARKTWASAPYRIIALALPSDPGEIWISQTRRMEYVGIPATSYDVRYIRSNAPDKSDANWTLLENLAADPIWETLSYTVTGLPNGKWYLWQARAVNAVGPGQWSETHRQRASGIPSPPVLDMVTAGDGSLTLGWHRPEDDGGVRIIDYAWCYIRSDTPYKPGNWTCGEYHGYGNIVDLPYLTRTIKGLTNNVQYDVKVYAQGWGHGSDWSNILTGTPRKVPGPPAISGPALVGATLEVDTSAIADDDGLTNPVFRYQWVRNDVNGDTNMAGATESTYTLVADDEGKTIKVRVSFTDDEGNEETQTSAATEEVASEVGPLTEFTVVDTSSDPDTVLATLEDGDTLTPASAIYGIRVDTSSNGDIHRVELELSGKKDVDKTEYAFPYSLYGDDGADNLNGGNLPVGSYILTATAYKQNGDALGILKVTFTVAEYQLQTEEQQTAQANSPATGAPTISGAARVSQTLTANTSDIADDDGLDNVVFSFQWLRGDAEIVGVTGDTYTLVADDEGQTIKVRVSFTDDRGHEESRTSDATPAVVPERGPLAGFSLVADGTGVELLALVEGVQVVTGDYSASSFAIRANLTVGETVGNVRFRLVRDGVNVTANGSKTESYAPYSLYGDAGSDKLTGEPLPEGSYLLEATAHAERNAQDDVLGRLEVSFTVVETAPTPADTPAQQQQQEPAPVQNSSATGVPTIDGEARVGQTLTADVSTIADDDGLDSAVFGYQWLRDDRDIAGATGQTYTLVEADEGQTIKVTVSFTDEAGHGESLTSDPTGAVEAKPNTEATGAPTIDGIAQVGQTLTANTSGIIDDDGLTNVAFTHQWTRSDGGTDTNIQDATGSTYTLVEADVGRTIKVTVSFTDDAGNTESLTSDPTGEVAAKPNSDATGQPTIRGTAQVGQTLTANTSGIADDDGLTNPDFAYQWARSDGGTDSNIQDAIGSTYTLTEDDAGRTIKLTVSFTDDAGNSETLPSVATGEVAPKPNTQATGQPTISGTAQVGQTLTADVTSIADEDGLSNVAFSYQWVRSDGDSDTNLQDATGSSYTLVAEDEGRTVKVKVSFTDAQSNPETLTSDPTGEVEAAETVPSRPQDLDGEASAQGIKLTWKAPSGSAVTQYAVYRGILQNGSMNGQPMTKYATIDATGEAMAYTDASVESGVEYRYRVAAVNSAGEGNKSNWLDIAAGDSES